MIARYPTIESAMEFVWHYSAKPCRVIQGATGLFWVVEPKPAALLVEFGFQYVDGMRNE
jgi:hypothetical protein